MKKKLLLSVFIYLFVTISLYAQKPPTMPISYNSTALSARNFAMGQIGAAIPADIGTAVLNPATLGFVSSDKIQAEVMVGIIRDTDLNKNEVSLKDNIDLGLQSFIVLQQQGAISWRTLSSNEIEINDGNDKYKKHERIKAITISAANKTEKGNSSVGLNISYLYGTISESSIISNEPFAQSSYGNGFSIDLGYMTRLNNLSFGLTLENIIGFMWWEEYDYDQLPFGIRTGMGYSLGTFNIYADWNKKFYRFGNYDDNIFGVGLEQYLGKVLCIRVGANTPNVSEKEKIKYTYGCGLNISMFSVSLAGESYKINDESISKYVISLKVLI